MLLNALTIAITLVYPFALWFGAEYVEPRWLSIALLLAVLARLPKLKASKAGVWLVLAAVVLMALAVWKNAMLPLKLYPFLVNLGMLALFGFSLVYPPTVIERIARIREPDLPAKGVAYTRRVTQVWCVFFIFNGSMALFTAFWSSHDFWSLYNGVIAYLLMGLLFAAEYAIRMRFKRRHGF